MRRSRTFIPVLPLLFAAPILHPLLLPLIGVPSHLLWWVHVLPVAWITFVYGRRAAVLSVAGSSALVASGEVLFGAGYWSPADWHTVLSLTFALTGTNLLIAGFALYARRVSHTYRLLFERAALGIVNTDRMGRIRGMNPLAETLLGTTAFTANGHALAQVLGLPPQISMDDVSRAGGWSGRIRPASAERSLQVVVASIPQADLAGSQVLILDRTLEAAQEQQLARSSQLATLGEALAGVAHELKNPLAVIRGYADLGLADAEPGEAAEYFSEIGRSAERMHKLISELLGMSRPSSAATAAIRPLIGRIVALQQVAWGHRVRIEVEMLYDGEVAGSADRIEQIVANLLSNSADAMNRESGVITIRCKATNGMVAIIVRDNGDGISPEILPRLFEPFMTSKTEGAGTGLGLAIARRLAIGMGGDLTGRNHEHGGAEFTLTVPVAGGDESMISRGLHAGRLFSETDADVSVAADSLLSVADRVMD